jgi:hypothetical protein
MSSVRWNIDLCSYREKFSLRRELRWIAGFDTQVKDWIGWDLRWVHSYDWLMRASLSGRILKNSVEKIKWWWWRRSSQTEPENEKLLTQLISLLLLFSNLVVISRSSVKSAFLSLKYTHYSQNALLINWWSCAAMIRPPLFKVRWTLAGNF